MKLVICHTVFNGYFVHQKCYFANISSLVKFTTLILFSMHNRTLKDLMYTRVDAGSEFSFVHIFSKSDDTFSAESSRMYTCHTWHDSSDITALLVALTLGKACLA